MMSKALILGVACLIHTVTAKSFEEDLTLTKAEKEALDKFRELVLATVDLPQDYMKEDIYLIRWLRARNLKLEESKLMLEKNLKWRKDNKMDTIHTEDWSYYERTFPYSLKGRDREGKPILYVNIGSMDFRQEVVVGKLDRLVHWVDKGIDETSNLVRDLGKKYQNVSQAILILNVEGFSLTRHACLRCIPAILSIMVTYENYYPGLADKLIVINFPGAAEPILRGARSLLHPDTNRVLKAYGPNRKVWQSVLNEYIDRSELPTEIGGSKTLRILDYDDY